MEQAAISYTRRYYRTTLFFNTFLIIVIGALLSSVVVLAIFPSHLGSDYGAALYAIQNMEASFLGRIIWIYILTTVLVIAAIGYLHVFYSHRIAGPAYRLGREAQLIGQGNLKADFQLRKKDDLTDMSVSLKQAAARYRETVEDLNKQTDAVTAQADVLDQMIRQGKDRTSLDAALQELSNLADKNNATLARIKTL